MRLWARVMAKGGRSPKARRERIPGHRRLVSGHGEAGGARRRPSFGSHGEEGVAAWHAVPHNDHMRMYVLRPCRRLGEQILGERIMQCGQLTSRARGRGEACRVARLPRRGAGGMLRPQFHPGGIPASGTGPVACGRSAAGRDPSWCDLRVDALAVLLSNSGPILAQAACGAWTAQGRRKRHPGREPTSPTSREADGG